MPRLQGSAVWGVAGGLALLVAACGGARGPLSLHEAVEQEDLGVVREALAAGADLEARNEDEETPLHVASRLGFWPVERALLAAGANPRVVDADGKTPLHRSVWGEHSMRGPIALLRSGADPTARDALGGTPLHGNIHRRNARILVDRGADMNAQDSVGRTPLHIAPTYERGGTVMALAGLGADVERADQTGQTPLHVAAVQRSVSPTRTLIEAGADVNRKDNAGQTPLHMAAMGGRRSVLDELVKLGADPRAVDDKGRTPHDAALEAGKDFNARGLFRFTDENKERQAASKRKREERRKQREAKKAESQEGQGFLRAVRCDGGRIRVERVEPPSGPGVRVRVRSAGICGSDLHMLDGGWPMAGTPGHEIAGELDDGRAVAVEPVIGCGECDSCRSGETNLCATQLERFVGIGRDGGMAEELLVPDACLVPLPEGVSPTDACLVEPLAVAVHGLRRASLRPGQRLAVVGGGSIGLCAVAAAPPGVEVALVARHDAQRAAGERLGASELSGHYDVVVDCAGTQSALELACGIARPGASLVLLASYWDGFAPPGMLLCTKEIKILPSFMYRRYEDGDRDVDAAARLLAERPEIASTLITHRFPLDAAAEAFEIARDRRSGAIKVVLSP